MLGCIVGCDQLQPNPTTNDDRKKNLKFEGFFFLKCYLLFEGAGFVLIFFSKQLNPSC